MKYVNIIDNRKYVSNAIVYAFWGILNDRWSHTPVPVPFGLGPLSRDPSVLHTHFEQKGDSGRCEQSWLGSLISASGVLLQMQS